MPPPVCPFVGVDAFIQNGRGEVCLVKRRDNGLWAMPGGYHDLGETASQGAAREAWEETGLRVEVKELLGYFSSLNYADRTGAHRGREICHLLFRAEVVGGTETLSDETVEIGWFAEGDLPDLHSGHAPRLEVAFAAARQANAKPHFD